jgi:hypothetical protein
MREWSAGAFYTWAGVMLLLAIASILLLEGFLRIAFALVFLLQVVIAVYQARLRSRGRM